MNWTSVEEINDCQNVKCNEEVSNKTIKNWLDNKSNYHNDLNTTYEYETK